MSVTKAPGNPASSREKNTHRPVIHQGHLHHSLEPAVLDPLRHVPRLHFLKEVVIKSLRLFSRRRLVEVGLVAFGRLGE